MAWILYDLHIIQIMQCVPQKITGMVGVLWQCLISLLKLFIVYLESLRYLSLHDNSYLRYFKGHRDKYKLIPSASRKFLTNQQSNFLSNVSYRRFIHIRVTRQHDPALGSSYKRMPGQSLKLSTNCISHSSVLHLGTLAANGQGKRIL